MENENKYKEALERAWDLYSGPTANVVTRAYLEQVFPELRDKKMVNRIRLCLDECVHSDVIRDYERDETMSYLEKRLNPANSVGLENKKEAPVSVNIDHFKSFMLQYLQDATNRKDDSEIEYVTNRWAEKLLNLVGSQEDRKPVLYEDEYQKMLSDSYKCGKDEVISNPEKYGLRKPAEWSEEDKGLLLSTKCIIDEVRNSENTFGYSKEELEDIWNWLNVAWTRLEYPKESNEWSDEDKAMLNKAACRLKDWDNIKAQQGYQDNYASKSPVKWVESLPERFNLLPKQKPVKCIEFDNEFKKQVSCLIASVLNGEYEYNKGYVEWVSQQLLGYARHQLLQTIGRLD